ncbi:MAG: hypothetical protein J3Q66DRAFT_366834 [Benniella sp.]|nr:MAG: hypothetical protein J3Q66DRAFT_366834 [Benniella sp.]
MVFVVRICQAGKPPPGSPALMPLPSSTYTCTFTSVLAIMSLSSLSLWDSELVVPPLADSGVVNGIDTAQKQMEYIKKNIAPLVGDSYLFLWLNQLLDHFSPSLSSTIATVAYNPADIERYGYPADNL